MDLDVSARGWFTYWPVCGALVPLKRPRSEGAGPHFLGAKVDAARGQVSVGVCRAEALVVANHSVVGAEDGVVGDVNCCVSVQIGLADEAGVAFR